MPCAVAHPHLGKPIALPERVARDEQSSPEVLRYSVLPAGAGGCSLECVTQCHPGYLADGARCSSPAVAAAAALTWSGLPDVLPPTETSARALAALLTLSSLLGPGGRTPSTSSSFHSLVRPGPSLCFSGPSARAPLSPHTDPPSSSTPSLHHLLSLRPPLSPSLSNNRRRRHPSKRSTCRCCFPPYQPVLATALPPPLCSRPGVLDSFQTTKRQPRT